MRQFALNGASQIVKKLLLDNYKKFVKNPFDEKKQIAQKIDKLNARLSVARNKLLSEIIDDDEYLEIKDECRQRIESLEEQLSKDGSDAKKINIDKSVDRALKYIENIPKLYSEGEINTRRGIIGSIFPEKLEFDRKNYRNARKNIIEHQNYKINN